MPALLILIFTIAMFFHPESVMAKSYGSMICEREIYYCYKVKRGDTWAKLFADENIRETVKRINRMNTRLKTGMKIAIPQDLTNTQLLVFSPLKQQIEPPDKKTIIVNYEKLAFGAYDENGALVHWGPISAGKGYCPDIRRQCNSPRGTFKIYRKEGEGCASSKFPVGRGGAPMPYCMFFHGGFALHGSSEVPGYHASHGCIRIFIDDAKWLNENFTHGEQKVTVILQ